MKSTFTIIFLLLSCCKYTFSQQVRDSIKPFIEFNINTVEKNDAVLSFDGNDYTIFLRKHQKTIKGYTLWSGKKKNTYGIFSKKENLTVGIIQTKKGRFLFTKNGDIESIKQISLDKNTICNSFSTLITSNNTDYYCNPSPVCSEEGVINLLILYTDEAIDELTDGDVNCDPNENAEATIVCLIEEINFIIHPNSGITKNYGIVHMENIDFSESNSVRDDLKKLKNPNDGNIDFVHNERVYYNADVVCMLTDGNYTDGSGIADLPYINVLRNGMIIPIKTMDEEMAFCIAEVSAALSKYTLAHEITHILGAGHDRPHLGGDPSSLLCTSSMGYVHPDSNWSTIMGACSDCGEIRIPYFSNPDVMYNGESTGNIDTANIVLVVEFINN